MPVEEVNMIFLEDWFHSHFADAESGVSHSCKGAQFVDSGEIVEVDSFDLNELGGKFVTIVGNRCFG